VYRASIGIAHLPSNPPLDGSPRPGQPRRAVLFFTAYTFLRTAISVEATVADVVADLDTTDSMMVLGLLMTLGRRRSAHDLE